MGVSQFWGALFGTLPRKPVGIHLEATVLTPTPPKKDNSQFIVLHNLVSPQNTKYVLPLVGNGALVLEGLERHVATGTTQEKRSIPGLTELRVYKWLVNAASNEANY